MSILPLEIERKYLIRRPEEQLLDALCCARICITQTYLCAKPGISRRLRRSETTEGVHYTMTEKRRLRGLIREEREREISEEEYKRLLVEADPTLSVIHKIRWKIPHGELFLEVDLFPFWSDRAFCEVELDTADREVELPDWITLIRDVTEEDCYTNRALACEIPFESLT